jgi:hypothetical protein
MKIEFEIADSDITAQIQSRIKDALKAKTNAYGADQYIKAAIDKKWPTAVDRLIEELLADSPKIKAAIMVEIEKKLRRKVAALINAGDASATP